MVMHGGGSITVSVIFGLLVVSQSLTVGGRPPLCSVAVVLYSLLLLMMDLIVVCGMFKVWDTFQNLF